MSDVIEVPHYLLIPVVGAYELHHSFEKPMDHLYRRSIVSGGTGKPYVDLKFDIDGEPIGKVHMLADPGLPLNERAREAMVSLCDVHVQFRGDVIFTGVPAELIQGLVMDQ